MPDGSADRSPQAPVEVFGHGAELHHQDVGQVLRLDLTSFFALKTDETGFVVHHDDPGFGAANEQTMV